MSNLTPKEIEKLIEKLGGEQGVREFLFGKTKTPVSEILSSLKPTGEHAVGPLAKAFVSKSFFRDDNQYVKLYTWDSFKNRILPSTGKISKQPVATLVSFNLTKVMYDREIHAELPENHIFSIEDLWMIADLINRQSKGESGPLLNNSYANLFYIQVGASVLVVGVGWRGSGWSIRVWGLGEADLWYVGHRVFSRNG